MGHPTRSGQDPILSRLELLARMMARSWAELPTKSPRTTLRTSTQNRYLHDTANTAYVESLSISCRETSQGLHLVMKAGLWIRSPNLDLVDGARTDVALVPQLAQALSCFQPSLRHAISSAAYTVAWTRRTRWRWGVGCRAAVPIRLGKPSQT